MEKLFRSQLISKREFLQMAGRAGRPRLWDIGYVGYLAGKGMELEYEELWEDAAVEAVCEEEAELVEELSLRTLKKREGHVKGKASVFEVFHANS